MQGAKLLLGVMVAIVLFTMSFFAVMGTSVHAQEKAKTGADPTDFITRYEPSYEHKELDNDGALDLFVLRTDLALRRDLSLRVDFPLIHFDPGSDLDRLGFDSETGFGDMITQLIYKPYSGDQLAAIIGLRIDWDTATEDEVGQGGTTFAPLGAVAWYPRGQWIIAPVLQWFLGSDLDNDPLPGDRDRNELSYRQLVLWQPMHKYVSWILLDPELIIDFEDDNDTDLVVGIEYGKLITNTIALFVKPSFGLGNSDTDWAIKIGFRHMFPGLFLFK
ncbi:MAG: hypothetical protein GTN74_17755 [Proteobacteria bacterium]|nr:hypothetical protein [Pseudomonadota bacterium]